MRDQLRQHRQDRRLDRRAGQWSGRLASERLDSFVRANRYRIAVVLAGFLAVGILLWFLLTPLGGARGFALGVYSASVISALYHWCVLASGAVNGTMGAAAEEWTSTELRRLRRKGWRTVNHLVFRNGDIDHVAVGPDGVLVVETKWRSDETRVDEIGWLQSAVNQVAANKKDVAGHLGWGARKDAPIVSLVVVWGPRVVQEDRDALVRTPEGVNVVPGELLALRISAGCDGGE